MFFHHNYNKAFWRGFLHAIALSLYLIFISLVYLSVALYFPVVTAQRIFVQLLFSVFLLVLSVGTCAYFIFFEPLKKVIHHQFREASIMIASTFGWLFIFLLVFIVGYIIRVM